MNDNVYIHMGYGRTGTTWLQNKVFSRIPDIQYLGKTKNSFPQWMINWNYLDRLFLPNEVDIIRNPIFHGLQQRGKVLISSEAFTQTGGIFDQIERIKIIVENAKVILVLRDPIELVLSKYRQLRKVGFFKKDLEYYLDYSSSPFDLVRRKRLYLHDYIYPLVTKKLYEDFGSQNTLVIKYEYLVSDPQGFVRVILGFLGVTDIPEIDFLPINKADNKIIFSQKTIDELMIFFTSFFNYEDIPNYIYEDFQ